MLCQHVSGQSSESALDQVAPHGTRDRLADDKTKAGMRLGLIPL